MAILTCEQSERIKTLAAGVQDAEYILKAIVGVWTEELSDQFLGVMESKNISGEMIVRLYEVQGTAAHMALQVVTCPSQYFVQFRDSVA